MRPPVIVLTCADVLLAFDTHALSLPLAFSVICRADFCRLPAFDHGGFDGRRQFRNLCERFEQADLVGVPLHYVFHLPLRGFSPVSLDLEIDVVVWQVEVWYVVPEAKLLTPVLQLD